MTALLRHEAIVEDEDPVTPVFVDPTARQVTRARQVMLEEAVFLRSFGTSWDLIADRLGVEPPSLRKALRVARADGLDVPLWE